MPLIVSVPPQRRSCSEEKLEVGMSVSFSIGEVAVWFTIQTIPTLKFTLFMYMVQAPKAHIMLIPKRTDLQRGTEKMKLNV